MKSLLSAGLSAAVCAALVAGTPIDQGPVQASAEVRLAGASQGATVLTLEGGLVGLQPFFHFTPLQLQGSLCKSPNTCKPVNYFAMPLGQWFNDQGAKKLTDAVKAQPAGSPPIVAFGHSQGGQVIYTAVRDWVANPAGAPSPDQVSWVSIGNPENAFGGRKKQDGLPPDTPYTGIEVIKEYDGWADAPNVPGNFLAWLNGQVGKSNTHVWGYFNVDLNSPNNTYYRPDISPGVPGNITYVFVPNDTLPLIQMTGILAPLLNPILDPILRPIVDAGYNRPNWPTVPGPVQVPPGSNAAVSVAAAQPASSATVRASSAVRQAPARRNTQPAGVAAVRNKPAAASASAAGQRPQAAAARRASRD